jgi:hypothetical protein
MNDRVKFDPAPIPMTDEPLRRTLLEISAGGGQRRSQILPFFLEAFSYFEVGIASRQTAEQLKSNCAFSRIECVGRRAQQR